MKLTKTDKNQIADALSRRCVCSYSKAAPMILRLAARKAKEMLDNAKAKTN